MSYWTELGLDVHYRLTVVGLCGHDPQLLLPDLRYTRLWASQFVDIWREQYPQIRDMWIDIDSGEYIDFEPRLREETTLYVDSAGTVVQEDTRYVPINRNLTPFVKPLDTGRWGEADVSPVADIERYREWMRMDGQVIFDLKDYPVVTMIDPDSISGVMEQRLIDKQKIAEYQMMFYQMSATTFDDLFGHKLVTAKAPAKRPPSYLKHDPTKKHRSVKRRRK